MSGDSFEGIFSRYFALEKSTFWKLLTAYKPLRGQKPRSFSISCRFRMIRPCVFFHDQRFAARMRAHGSARRTLSDFNRSQQLGNCRKLTSGPQTHALRVRSGAWTRANHIRDHRTRRVCKLETRVHLNRGMSERKRMCYEKRIH